MRLLLSSPSSPKPSFGFAIASNVMSTWCVVLLASSLHSSEGSRSLARETACRTSVAERICISCCPAAPAAGAFTGQIQICIHIVVAAQSVVCLRRRVRTQGLARMRQVKKERPAAIFSLTLQVEHSLSRATPHIWRPACGNHRDRRSLRRGRSARPAVVHQRTQLLSKTH